MIPKRIHYCWFGGNPKSELIKNCIASWQEKCPDYEIIEWNESNYDVTANSYVKEAYEAKKWAFVSDYARLDIIYNRGGVYLDTDVELYTSLDDLLKYDAFYCFESSRNINSGLGFGAVKDHASTKSCLGYYNGKHFIINGKPDLTPCPRGNTLALCEAYSSLHRNGETQMVENTLFLSPSEYELRMKHHTTGTWGAGYRLKRREYKHGKLKAG